MSEDIWEERAYLLNRIRMCQADMIAHAAEHQGPYKHTIGGSGPGSECCKYHEERYLAAHKAADDFEESVRNGTY